MAVELDWEAYFKEFCALHGKPVEKEGKLLFPDGWAYSAVEHSGPEYPPPVNEGELKACKAVYWNERKKIVEAELTEVASDLKYLEQLQSVKSAPLRQSVYQRSDDGKVKLVSAKIDWKMLMEKQRRLRAELDKVQLQLDELRTVGEEALSV